MKKLTEKIKEFMFGRRVTPVDTISIGIHTCSIYKKPMENDWFEEFKVSSMHGKKITYRN